MLRGDAKLALQRPEKGVKKIQEQGIALADRGAHLVIDQGGEDHRAYAVSCRHLGNTLRDFRAVLRRVYERQRDRAVVHAPELRQQAVAHGLSRHAGLVGNKKNRALGHFTPAWRLP